MKKLKPKRWLPAGGISIQVSKHDTKPKETVSLSKTTFEKLLFALEFYLTDTEEGIADLETYLREANFEHEIRFRLTDILAGIRMLEKLLKRVRAEAEFKAV